MASLSRVITDLQQSVISSETWSPTIFLPSVQFTNCPVSSNVLCNYCSTQHTVSVDVIKLMHQLQDHSDQVYNSFLKQQLDYPDSAAFELHGFIGLQRFQEVVDVVKTASLEGGTCLTIIRHTGTTDKK